MRKFFRKLICFLIGHYSILYFENKLAKGYKCIRCGRVIK